MWSSRSVFISSTFEDMQAERDHLRAFVFPELEERLAATRRHLEWVDLRIGVATGALETEEAREHHILKVCLTEVRRCRPFLIVLLGDRYGFAPSAERARAAAAEVGLEDVAGRSLTEMEILAGVLSDPKTKSCVYIREPLPYDAMPPDVAARYSEMHAAAGADRAARLTRLKGELGRALGGRVRRYRAAWDGGRVAGLEAWGRQVVEDLWRELGPTEPEPQLSPLDLERRALDDFIADMSRDFVGREVVRRDLIAHAEAKAGDWGVCVVGPPGQGKSALFATLHQDLSARGLFVLAHAPGARASSSVDAMLRRWIEDLRAALDLDLRGGVGEAPPADASPAQVDDVFAELLTRLSARRRVVVLVDALDQFDQTTRARFATWLPRTWPENARLIAVSVENEATAALAARPGVRMRSLEPIAEAEARAIVAAISARYGRTLEPAVVDALLAKRDGGAPAWGNPLWLSLAAEELNLLDADDFERARARHRGTAGQQLIAMMVEIVKRLPTTIGGVYRAAFAGAEERFGKPLVIGFLALLAVSRTGLRELDLRAALPRMLGGPLDPLALASLRRYFRGQLRQRRTLGQWDFSHAQMRAAVRQLLDDQRIPETLFHAALAESLLALPADDPLRESETMAHLIGSEAWERAARYLTDEALSENALANAVDVLSDIVLGTDGLKGVATVAKLLDVVDTALAANVASIQIYRLAQAIKGRVGLEVERALVMRIKETVERALEREPGHSRLQRDLAACFAMLGGVALAQGQSGDAVALLRRSINIGEQLVKGVRDEDGLGDALVVNRTQLATVLSATGRPSDALHLHQANADYLQAALSARPHDPDLKNQLATALGGIADVRFSAGDPATALDLYQRALGLQQSAIDERPHRQSNLAVTCERIGGVLTVLGRVGEADGMYRKSVEITERLAAADPTSLKRRADLSSAREHLGSHLLAMGRATDARVEFEASHAGYAGLVEKAPDDATWRSGLAIASSKLGNVAMAMRDLPAALAWYERGHAISEQLARSDPDDLERQRNLAVDLHRLGSVLHAMKRHDQALRRYEQSLEIVKRLAPKDPSNAQWSKDVATNLFHIARLNADLGNLPETRRRLREGIAVRERLAETAPDDPNLRFALAADIAALADFDDDPRRLRLRARDILRKLDADFGLTERQRSLLQHVESDLR